MSSWAVLRRRDQSAKVSRSGGRTESGESGPNEADRPSPIGREPSPALPAHADAGFSAPSSGTPSRAAFSRASS